MKSENPLLQANAIPWLIAAAAFFRLASLYFTPTVNLDSCRYINSAHAFLAGNVSAGFAYAGSLPTYPWLLLAVHSLGFDWILAGQLVSAACLVLAVVPLYLLTRDLFGAHAAVWSGLAFALSPTLNNYAAEIIREPPFALVFLWTAYFVRKACAEARPLDFLWIALLSLLAISLRFEMVVFFLGFPLLLGFFAVRDRLRRIEWLKGLAIFVAVPAVVLLATVPLLMAHSVDVRLGGGVNVFLKELLRFDVLGSYPIVYAKLAALEPAFPNAQFAHDAVETARHLLPLIYLIGLLDAVIASLFPLFVILALWGLRCRPRENVPGRRPVLFLAGIFLLAAYFVLLNRNFISDRYLLAPMLLLLPWVGWGMHHLLSRLEAVKFARGWSIGAIALFLVFPAWNTVGRWEQGPGVQQVAGHWLRDDHDQPGIRLLVNDERIPLYAGYWMGEYQAYPEDAFENLEKVALENNRNLIAIRTAKKKRQAIPDFAHYKLIKSFEDRKHAVSYYQVIN